MFSSPWSLEFVLAVVIGAMLVPGCRPVEDDPNVRPPHPPTLGEASTVQPGNQKATFIGEIPTPIPGVNGPRSSIYITP